VRLAPIRPFPAPTSRRADVHLGFSVDLFRTGTWPFQLVIVGPELNASYAAEVKAQCRTVPALHVLPPVEQARAGPRVAAGTPDCYPVQRECISGHRPSCMP
jgi:hypothetical protein